MTSLSRISSFKDIQGEWQRILSYCTINTLFMTSSWQEVWWQEFGDGAEMMLLCLKGANGVEGIAPMFRRNGIVALIGNQDVCDYNDFLVPQGRETFFYPTLLEYLETEKWEAIELFSLPEDSPTLIHLPKMTDSLGLLVNIEKEDVAPGVSLPNSWEEYLQSLSKKDRHELRRKLRRLSSANGLRSSKFSTPSEVERELDAFLHLMRLSGEDKQEFLTPQRERFFRSISKNMAEQGILKLFFMELEGQKVASAICFDYGTSRLLYNSGFDPAFSYYSVGLLLKALCLKDAIEEGKQYFDFLRGPESYKYDLGGKDRLLYHIKITRR